MFQLVEEMLNYFYYTEYLYVLPKQNKNRADVDKLLYSVLVARLLQF